MAIDERDLHQLQRALDLAETAVGRSDPNPRVGCVLHDAGGRLAGEGATQPAGDAHAELVALRQATANGADLRRGTAWVTLEPCSHHGRTPPCCDALIAARLARVVVATIDPNPQVAGAGVRRLREAGLTVELADGLPLARRARELNIGFFSRMIRGRPWVRMKLAASLDGKTALPDGQSQWITSEAARTDGHAWRRRAGALLTGAGTVLADDPRLDVRLVPIERQPVRVVVDARLQCPTQARIFAPPGQVLVYCATDATAPDAAATGVERIKLADSNGKVHLRDMLDDLARRGINELHVEAGEKLNASFLREHLVDELLLYLAPTILGAGLDMFAGPTIARLADAPRLVFAETAPVGHDLRIRARFVGRDAFLA